jgi:putative heme iron utilization protein
LAAISEGLQGVDYVSLDEISMVVSCNDLQLLTTQSAKARNIHDDSFGSLSLGSGRRFRAAASHDRTVVVKW